jgi:hypothetical protein
MNSTTPDHKARTAVAPYLAVGISTVVLRTEVFRRMYESPIHPKNLRMEQDPLKDAEVDEVADRADG